MRPAQRKSFPFFTLGESLHFVIAPAIINPNAIPSMISTIWPPPLNIMQGSFDQGKSFQRTMYSIGTAKSGYSYPPTLTTNRSAFLAPALGDHSCSSSQVRGQCRVGILARLALAGGEILATVAARIYSGGDTSTKYACCRVRYACCICRCNAVLPALRSKLLRTLCLENFDTFSTGFKATVTWKNWSRIVRW